MKRTLGIAALTLALAGCGGGYEPDLPAMESEVATGIEDQLKLNNVRLDCPDSVEWEAGEDFHCFADTEGVNLRVTVSMENDDGEWSWFVG